MKVSVISTVKNGEEMLQDTVNSIINQTFNDWEFLIVDDGSTDRTPLILKDLTLKDPRIKVIETKGVGRAKALNLAIENAEGTYIANVDVDDPSHPKRLEVQLRAIEDNLLYSCMFSESVFLWENEIPMWNESDFWEDLRIEEISEVLYKYNPLNHSSLFISKELLISIGKYDEKRKSLLDYELWLRIHRAGYRIGKIKETLASKRIHKNQSFESKKRIRYLNATRKLKIENSFSLKHSTFYKILANINFFYGLLPSLIRSKIKKTYKFIKG